MSKEEILSNKLENIFGESCGYSTLEESGEDFILRRARELEDGSRISHSVLNNLLLDTVITAYQTIENLPKYHAVVDGDTAHIDFEFDTRVVMLAKNKDEKRDHVYWQDSSIKTDCYGGDYNFTHINIINWLKWLVTGKSRPDRQLICPWCDESRLVVRKRTEKQILNQTNELAREFYRLMGYVAPQTHKFYEMWTNTHPTEILLLERGALPEYD